MSNFWIGFAVGVPVTVIFLVGIAVAVEWGRAPPQWLGKALRRSRPDDQHW